MNKIEASNIFKINSSAPLNIRIQVKPSINKAHSKTKQLIS